jgi:uncharacterized protein (TIRG00374 family)
LANLAIKILRLFHVKNVDKVEKSLAKTLEEYQSSVVYVKQNKKMFINILLTSLIQIVCMHSVTFMIYKAFGLSQYSYLTILSLQSILYVAVSSLPFPGAVGVSESAFMLLFKMMYSDKILPSAMILSRFVSFYLCVLITGSVLAIIYLRKGKKGVKNEVNSII